MSWWSAMACLESCSDPFELKIFFSIISYPASQYGPVLFFLFVVKYTQMDGWLTSGKKTALFILPTISCLIAATNTFHHILWTKTILTESVFTGSYVIYTHGPWFWVIVAYSYTLLAIAICVLILASFRYSLLNSFQYRWILVASLFPIVGNIIYVFFFSSVKGIDPTPLLLSFSSIFFTIGIIRFSILDIIPIAREQVLEYMKEGMITIDSKTRILDINPSAIVLLNLHHSVVGSSITEILPGWPSMNATTTEQSGILPQKVNETIRWLTWSSSKILDSEERLIGICLLIQDVTSNHEMEEQLRNQAIHLEDLTKDLTAAHKSLQLMTSITRHDILNMITVQRGYMEIALAEESMESYERAVKKSYPAVLKIQELITLTHEYQKIGMSHPAWISLASIILKTAEIFREENGKITSSIPESIEIFADSVFEKVFFVFIDNALRHGGGVTRVHFSCIISANLTVIIEDNGVGIPEIEKKTVFYRGVGKNTGLGLYLAREILLMNLCTIKETGKPGNGARFEIDIPPDRWRERTVQFNYLNI
jgi:signal transduction histidine kinase